VTDPVHVVFCADISISMWFQFDHSGRSRLTKSKLGLLLNEVGACLDFFNVTLDNYITIEEFGDTVSLSDNELDIYLDKIRKRLLSSSSGSGNTTGQAVQPLSPQGDSTSSAGGKPGGNKLRDHRLLSQIFGIINTSGSGMSSC
jgi:hypothetical protein